MLTWHWVTEGQPRDLGRLVTAATLFLKKIIVGIIILGDRRRAGQSFKVFSNLGSLWISLPAESDSLCFIHREHDANPESSPLKGRWPLCQASRQLAVWKHLLWKVLEFFLKVISGVVGKNIAYLVIYRNRQKGLKFKSSELGFAWES